MIPWTFDHVEVTRVVDGDTIDCTIDVGFHMRIQQRFRLIGINTPERGQEGYQEAKSAAEGWFLEHKTFRLSVTKAEKYGRYLVEVLCEDNRSLNAVLLEAGLAKPYV